MSVDKKYKAQITIEVELTCGDNFSSKDEECGAIKSFLLYSCSQNTQSPWSKSEIISSYIIQDPPEQEWLENLLCTP